jgi:carboxypeptidase C (cathepsin A)
MSDANKESIMKMAENYPKESMELLRIAHCASKKHREQVQKFNDFKEMSENMALKQQFESVMSRKRTRPEVQTQVHVASKKQKSTANQALSIIQKYRSSGSARDHMTAMSEYQTPKRRNRAPYY